MTIPSRFGSPSACLSPRSLLRRTRRGLWMGLGLAVVAHLCLPLIARTAEQQRVAKPLTTQFVKRQPRLTKPLELKKRPQPKRRQVEREMVAVRARARDDRVGVRLQPGQVLRGLARPDVRIGRVVGSGGGQAEPEAFAGIIEGAKEEEHKIDLSLEMMDVGSLDTGRYRAMVVQDPTDKRQIRGFLHLASAYPATASLPENEGRRWPEIIQALVRAVNRFTDIRADLQGRLTFDSAELLKLPFLYTRIYWPFRLSGSESAQLGCYLVRGGFLFAETVPSGSGYFPAYEPVRKMVADALKVRGLEEDVAWSLERLPDSHGVYHCYFDFDGPPVGNDWQRGNYPGVDYLEGAISSGRVLAVICQKNYAHPWVDWGPGRYWASLDPTRQLQFAVNLIVFALTQEGSITHRLMDSLAY